MICAKMINNVHDTIGEFFNRQAVFSIDASRLLPEVYSILEGITIYEDHFQKKYLVPVHESDLKYPELMIRIEKHNISFSKVDRLIWLSINELHSAYPKSEHYLIKSRRLDEIDQAIMYPASPIYGGRLYHLVHYNDESSQLVSDRLVDLCSFYNDEFGDDTFRIEQIKSVIDNPIDFIKKYSPSSELVYMKVRFHGGQNKMVGILNYPTLSLEENGFIIKIQDSVVNMKLKGLEDLLKTSEFSPSTVFREAKKQSALAIYLDASCVNGQCFSNVVVERKLMKYFNTIIRNLLSQNFKIEVNEYLIL